MYRLKPSLLEGATQAGGVQILPISRIADYHYVTITPSVGATGTVSFEVRSTEDTPWEPVTDGGTPFSIDLATTDLSFILDGRFISDLRITPTSVVGSFSIIVQQASQ